MRGSLSSYYLQHSLFHPESRYSLLSPEIPDWFPDWWDPAEEKLIIPLQHNSTRQSNHIYISGVAQGIEGPCAPDLNQHGKNQKIFLVGA